MAFLSVLPEPTNLSDVLKAFPKGAPALLAYHDAVLRGPSPLKIAERELIAAYVSGLNRCRFCHNAHTLHAEHFGIDPALFAPLVDDLETAEVEARMKPVLRLARKLTEDAASVSADDHAAIIDAGWPEEAVADTIFVTALFNFMNRVVTGFGVDPHDALFDERRGSVRKMRPERREALNESKLGSDHYMEYGRSIGVVD